MPGIQYLSVKLKHMVRFYQGIIVVLIICILYLRMCAWPKPCPTTEVKTTTDTNYVKVKDSSGWYMPDPISVVDDSTIRVGTQIMGKDIHFSERVKKVPSFGGTSKVKFYPGKNAPNPTIVFDQAQPPPVVDNNFNFSTELGHPALGWDSIPVGPSKLKIGGNNGYLPNAVPNEGMGFYPVELIKRAQQKVYYEDTLATTYGDVIVKDTIQNNRITSRKWITEFSIPVVTTTTTQTVEEKKRGQLYIGMDIIGGRFLPDAGVVQPNNLINQFGPSLMWKTKTDKVYEGGILYNTAGSYGVRLSTKFLISFKKRRS